MVITVNSVTVNLSSPIYYLLFWFHATIEDIVSCVTWVRVAKLVYYLYVWINVFSINLQAQTERFCVFTVRWLDVTKIANNNAAGNMGIWLGFQIIFVLCITASDGISSDDYAQKWESTHYQHVCKLSVLRPYHLYISTSILGYM